MKILISAAEASSDLHGAHLLAALKSQTEVEAFGIGGPQLKSAGLEIVVDARELLSMGFYEILGRLPKIIKSLNEIAHQAEVRRPDIAVVIDYPDFHFKLAKRLKKLGIPVVYYIPPKVWAWRKGRVRLLQDLFVKVLCIFPFERGFFEKVGLNIKYVGNPLLDELPLKLTRSEARQKLGLDLNATVVTLMPGSRPSELKRHLEVVLDSVLIVAKRLREVQRTPVQVLIPLPMTADRAAVEQRLQDWLMQAKSQNHDIKWPEFRVTQGDSAVALIASDAAIVKSGTSTLEAAVLACPHVVLYKASVITWWIYKYLIRYPGPIALSNLVAGKKPGDVYLAKELIGPFATSQAIAEELFELLTDSERKQKLAEEFLRVREILAMGQGASPSANAALEILSLIRPGSGPGPGS